MVHIIKTKNSTCNLSFAVTYNYKYITIILTGLKHTWKEADFRGGMSAVDGLTENIHPSANSNAYIYEFIYSATAI